jgi:hypothetical protein
MQFGRLGWCSVSVLVISATMTVGAGYVRAALIESLSLSNICKPDWLDPIRTQIKLINLIELVLLGSSAGLGIVWVANQRTTAHRVWAGMIGTAAFTLLVCWVGYWVLLIGTPLCFGPS